MASTFNFQVFSDNSENENAMRGKQNVSKLQGGKRAPLESITNYGNARVQPLRAAKQPLLSSGLTNIGTENISSKVFGGKSFSQTQPFGVHIDSQSDSSTHPANRGHKDLTTHHNEESPMVLDTSASEIFQERTVYSAEERLERMLTVSDYADEIYKFIREQELRHRAKPNYMKKQPDISQNMRCILVDWLVEVAEEYKLHRETLCLAVNYIDRFLSQMSVLRGKLQLVGAASMFLAAKYEEIYPPEVGEFVYITDDTYSKNQVLRMEHLILKVLSFDVAVPTVNCFCEKFLNDCKADDKTKSLAMYLLELTMIDGDVFLKHLPSEIAAACVCLAKQTLNQEAWPESLSSSTQYSLSQLEPCLQDLYAAFIKAPNHPQQAVHQKYKSSKYHHVADLTPPALPPTAALILGTTL